MTLDENSPNNVENLIEVLGNLLTEAETLFSNYKEKFEFYEPKVVNTEIKTIQQIIEELRGEQSIESKEEPEIEEGKFDFELIQMLLTEKKEGNFKNFSTDELLDIITEVQKNIELLSEELKRIPIQDIKNIDNEEEYKKVEEYRVALLENFRQVLKVKYIESSDMPNKKYKEYENKDNASIEKELNKLQKEINAQGQSRSYESNYDSVKPKKLDNEIEKLIHYLESQVNELYKLDGHNEHEAKEKAKNAMPDLIEHIYELVENDTSYIGDSSEKAKTFFVDYIDFIEEEIKNKKQEIVSNIHPIENKELSRKESPIKAQKKEDISNQDKSKSENLNNIKNNVTSKLKELFGLVFNDEKKVKDMTKNILDIMSDKEKKLNQDSHIEELYSNYLDDIESEIAKRSSSVNKAKSDLDSSLIMNDDYNLNSSASEILNLSTSEISLSAKNANNISFYSENKISLSENNFIMNKSLNESRMSLSNNKLDDSLGSNLSLGDALERDTRGQDFEKSRIISENDLNLDNLDSQLRNINSNKINIKGLKNQSNRNINANDSSSQSFERKLSRGNSLREMQNHENLSKNINSTNLNASDASAVKRDFGHISKDEYDAESIELSNKSLNNNSSTISNSYNNLGDILNKNLGDDNSLLSNELNLGIISGKNLSSEKDLNKDLNNDLNLSFIYKSDTDNEKQSDKYENKVKDMINSSSSLEELLNLVDREEDTKENSTAPNQIDIKPDMVKDMDVEKPNQSTDTEKPNQSKDNSTAPNQIDIKPNMVKDMDVEKPNHSDDYYALFTKSESLKKSNSFIVNTTEEIVKNTKYNDDLEVKTNKHHDLDQKASSATLSQEHLSKISDQEHLDLSKDSNSNNETSKKSLNTSANNETSKKSLNINTIKTEKNDLNLDRSQESVHSLEKSDTSVATLLGGWEFKKLNYSEIPPQLHEANMTHNDDNKSMSMSFEINKDRIHDLTYETAEIKSRNNNFVGKVIKTNNGIRGIDISKDKFQSHNFALKFKIADTDKSIQIEVKDSNLKVKLVEKDKDTKYLKLSHFRDMYDKKLPLHFNDIKSLIELSNKHRTNKESLKKEEKIQEIHMAFAKTNNRALGLITPIKEMLETISPKSLQTKQWTRRRDRELSNVEKYCFPDRNHKNNKLTKYSPVNEELSNVEKYCSTDRNHKNNKLTKSKSSSERVL